VSCQARCEELARQLGVSTDDVVERWAERAAIREHDGGQPRELAERDAFEDVRVELAPPLVAGERRGPHASRFLAASDSVTVKK
jgi:hypothetical protein